MFDGDRSIAIAMASSRAREVASFIGVVVDRAAVEAALRAMAASVHMDRGRSRGELRKD
jgi:hypothetical protein